jgi:hypothetical protein
MPNRIRTLRVWDTRLDPAEAELHIAVELEELTSTMELRGRLVGPTCAYSRTVEVAYPLRAASRTYASEGVPSFAARVVIPEACFWEPATPFLYAGPVELWQAGTCVEGVEVSHGLRLLRLGQRGLRLNDKLITLRGVQRSVLSAADADGLRRAGCNMILAPVEAGSRALWADADRFGFLMIGRMSSRPQLTAALALEAHASCLGWLLAPEAVEDELVRAGGPALLRGFSHALVGVELEDLPREPLPEGIDFVACRASLTAAVAHIGLPILVLEAADETISISSPGILGTVSGERGAG